MPQPMTEPMSYQQGEHRRSAVERIASFVATARPEHVTGDIRKLLKRNILDSLGCGIAALPGQPFQALRDQFEEYRAPGRCTLIGPQPPTAPSRVSTQSMIHVSLNEKSGTKSRLTPVSVLDIRPGSVAWDA